MGYKLAADQSEGQQRVSCNWKQAYCIHSYSYVFSARHMSLNSRKLHWTVVYTQEVMAPWWRLYDKQDNYSINTADSADDKIEGHQSGVFCTHPSAALLYCQPLSKGDARWKSIPASQGCCDGMLTEVLFSQWWREMCFFCSCGCMSECRVGMYLTYVWRMTGRTSCLV